MNLDVGFDEYICIWGKYTNTQIQVNIFVFGANEKVGSFDRALYWMQ